MKHFLDPCLKNIGVDSTNYFPDSIKQNYFGKIGKLAMSLLLFMGLNANLFSQCLTVLPAADITKTLPLTCEGTDSFTGKTGNVFEFTIDNAKSYEFKICANGFTPQADLWDDPAVFLVSSGVADADGCVTISYAATGATCTSADDLIYLGLYSHSCLQDWKDVTIDVTSKCCQITCAPDVHVAASQASPSCTAASFNIPVPTVTGACDETMVSYAIDPAMPLLPDATIDITNITAIVVPAGVTVDVYTITWTVEDCDGGSYICKQKVIIEPIMVCDDVVNITLGTGCWVDITPGMLIEAPCADLADYTVCVDGNAPGDKTIRTPGMHKVTIKYTPSIPNQFSNVSCWGYVNVEDKSGPSCSITAAEEEENISCGEDVPCAEPEFEDCTGVDDITMFEEQYGECGLIGGADILTATRSMTGLTVDGILIPAPIDDSVADYEAAGFVLDHVIVKTWQATDVLGFTSNSCNQFIYVWRPGTIIDPIAPIEVECGTSLDPCTLAEINPRWVPHYKNPVFDILKSTATLDDSTAIDDAGNLEFLPLCDVVHLTCKYSVSFIDKPVADICGTTEKFIRQWTVLDWCTDVAVVGPKETQLIKTVDTVAPEWTNCPKEGDQGFDPSNPIVLTTIESHHDCQFEGLITPPSATDACSMPVSYSGLVYSTVTTATGTGTGFVISTISDFASPITLNEGLYWIAFEAEDDCGNTSEDCGVYYEVVDDSNPVAICDLSTTISLTNAVDGDAWICADNLDSGSYDNCGVEELLIKRMSEDDSEFSPCFIVNCSDLGVLMVVLRVVDATGNYSECMVELSVQDKIGPTIKCPAPISVTCQQDYTDLSLTGNVIADATEYAGIDGYAFDNCNLDSLVLQPDVVDVDCGEGTVFRTWTAYSNGLSTSCTQEITIVPDNDFFITFPKDIILTDCPTSVGTIERPIVSGQTCAEVAISMEDQQYDVVDGACYKILRTWTVINWCNYEHLSANITNGGIPDASNPNKFSDDGDGYFKYVQVIKIEDSTAPVFSNCPETTVDTPIQINANSGTCEANIEDYISRIFASDNCSTEIDYTFQLVDEDGTISYGFSNQVSGAYPMGAYTVTMYADDNCGNRGKCEFHFIVLDMEGPEIGCHHLSAPLMENGTLEVWAKDLIEETLTYDKCNSNDELVVTIIRSSDSDGTNAPSATALTFTCDDLAIDSNGNRVATNILVEVWVTDSNGNSNFCETLFTVTINDVAICPTVITGSGSAEIAGRIYDEMDQAVENVMVEVTSSSMTMNPFLTTTNGTYAFADLVDNANYTIEPEKDVNPLNGVSTYDLVLISQHIIGTAPLTSPYKKIAADVNNSGTITTFDLVQLRQLILFVITDFPTNKSWRFVDADYAFTNNDPFASAFPEVVNFNFVNDSELADFVAIKIGDINNSASPLTLLGSNDRSANSITLSTDEQNFSAGERVAVPIAALGLKSIDGFQYTFSFDTETLDFIDFDGAEISNINAGNFGYTMLDEGIITTSWNTQSADDNVLVEGALYTLNFVAKKAGVLSEVIDINSRYTDAEAINQNEVFEIDFVVETITGKVVAEAFELFQNQPNPFTQHTTIGFNMAVDGVATIRVIDLAGRELISFTDDFSKGFNEVTVNKNDLNTSGVLYYQVETNEGMATKKMIIIE